MNKCKSAINRRGIRLSNMNTESIHNEYFSNTEDKHLMWVFITCYEKIVFKLITIQVLSKCVK
jgi:hypothetical protein